MSCFEIKNENDDLDLELIKYNNFYLTELTFYGSSKNEQMMMLIDLSQRLNVLEKKLIKNYYNVYVLMIKKDIEDPNIYYLQKILFSLTNNLAQMLMLWTVNKTDTEECQFKLRYLVGCIENFIEKVIEPIETELEQILKSNLVFELKYPLTYLKKFIGMNKSMFTSNDKVKKLNNFMKMLNDL
jgi:hypothetical protein